MPRKQNRIGARRYRADVTQHDGTQDAHGTPTYTTPGDWDTVATAMPVEKLTVSGGEILRGRQVTAETSHVFIGEFHTASSVEPDMRVTVDSVVYSVITAYDHLGDRREFWMEAKREA